MLEWRFNNQQPKNELSIVNFKAIGLLEVRIKAASFDGEKYHYAKNF